jgi:shikimate kinase
MIKNSGANIILIGMMGSGKTTVAKEIGKASGRILIDTDDMVVGSSGMSISDIFENFGENKFREIERDVILNISKAQNLVVSTGGGVVKNPENVSSLRSTGNIVYLRCSAETLAARLIGEADGRPLIKPYSDSIENLTARIKDLLVERNEIYSNSCDLIVDVDGKSAQAIALEILESVSKKAL